MEPTNINPQWAERSAEEETLIKKEAAEISKEIARGKSKKEDKVNHPSHYTWLKKLCGIEVIDITRHMCFNLGNVVKYVLRAGHKSEKGYTESEKEIEDLKKAKWYLEDEIKFRSGKDISDKALIQNLKNEIAELERINCKLAEANYHHNKVSKIGKFALTKKEWNAITEILNNEQYADIDNVIYIEQAHCGGIGIGTNLIITRTAENEKTGETIVKDVTDYSCW